jgi:hypothetical protein
MAAAILKVLPSFTITKQMFWSMQEAVNALVFSSTIFSQPSTGLKTGRIMPQSYLCVE